MNASGRELARKLCLRHGHGPSGAYVDSHEPDSYTASGFVWERLHRGGKHETPRAKGMVDKNYFNGPRVIIILLSGLLLLTSCAGLPVHGIVGGQTIETRSEEHTSELQSLRHLVCRLLLEKKKKRS